jgi:FKBP-type peptidyl-prolyl cis-trans isomerase FklB
MKAHPARRLLPPALSYVVLLAIAPLAGAQTRPAASGAPPPPAAQAAPAAPPAPPAPPELSNDQAGYLFGLTFGEQLHGIGLSNEEITDAIARGVKDGLQGKKSTPAERQQVQLYAQSMMRALQARNKSAAEKFLADNGHQKGVKTTASGLQYKVLDPGDAKAAPIAATDEVTVNYRGKLIDGTEFDSSYTRGTPATFPVNGVIRGWQEALVLMKPGAKWKLFVPPELGYGPNPRPNIPANSVLIFDVELLGVKSNGGAPQGAMPPPRALPGAKAPTPPTPQ